MAPCNKETTRIGPFLHDSLFEFYGLRSTNGQNLRILASLPDTYNFEKNQKFQKFQAKILAQAIRAQLFVENVRGQLQIHHITRHKKQIWNTVCILASLLNVFVK
jgi:hypothetical protein